MNEFLTKLYFGLVIIHFIYIFAICAFLKVQLFWNLLILEDSSKSESEEFFKKLFTIFLADDGSIGSNEELQKVLGEAMSQDFDCFSAEDFKEGLGPLGKLDDTMMR